MARADLTPPAEVARPLSELAPPAEVARHDRADDLWVSLFHRVLDLTELVASTRNFTRSVPAASAVSANNVGILVTLSTNPPNQKIQSLSIDCVKNLMRIQELDRAIKQLGGHEIVLLVGESNKFAFK